MRKKIFKDISASATQTIINQSLGLLIFIITSRYLSKDIYGEMNWSLAILTFTTSILSLRLEQIVVHKVAAAEDASKMLTLFTAHSLITGVLFYILLLLGAIIYPSFFARHNLLLILSISHLLSFFSSPFKQVANGKEEFNYLAVMSSISNLIRSIWLLIVVTFLTLTISQVLIIYICSSLIELLVSFYIVSHKLNIKISSQWKVADYAFLLKESLPQIGSVVLMASIARIDWILLGIFTNPVQIAEYSFAYKVYELSPFPMLVLAPILLSRFSRYFTIYNEESLLERKKDLSLLIRIQMICATLIPLLLNIVWSPLMDALTGNKYGAVNKFTFFILSLCIPLQYMINLLWSIHFAQSRLKLIFRIALVTCTLIIIGDLLLIPPFRAQGAAIAYLIAITVEYILYLRFSALNKLYEMWQFLLYFTLIALISGIPAYYISENIFVKPLIAFFIYSCLVIGTKLFTKKDWISVLALTKKK